MPSDYDRIREENLREYGEGTRHLELFQRLYADKTHFVFELLQNAEDANARAVRFDLHPDRLEVRHDGRLFDEKDVRGVCGVGEGSKADDLTQIGKFGIGFKSVYAYTACPEIHSGDEHFRIENYVRPYSVLVRDPEAPWTTLFVFPLKEPGSDLAQIKKRLAHLDARTLLFLRNVDAIEWSVDGRTGRYARQVEIDGPARLVRIVDGTPKEREPQEWLVFERQVRTPDKKDEVKVEAAFSLTHHDKADSETIVAVPDSPLVVFFPTEKDTHLGFLIQGAYRTTPTRENVPADDEWNRRLVEETGKLVVAALPPLRDMGLLTVSLLEAMPIDTDQFPEERMFRPIFDRVREALREQPLLPAHGGGFVAAKHAKLARGTELRELLSEEQLRDLFGSDTAWNWVTGDITSAATGDLHSYLTKELGIEEVTPDTLARRFDESFINAQPDEWVAKFYAFLDGQEGLWGEHRWRGNGLLRGKPFIRLEVGSHVPPFGDHGSPNAFLPPEEQTDYPIVKRSIAADDDARKFLRNLGLTEPEIVDEVIERVLPKYDTVRDVPEDEHQADLRKILIAMKTDSQTKRERLLEQLRNFAFVRTINAATGRSEFKRPGEVYQPSSDLVLYFAGSRDAWFLAEAADQEVGSEDPWKTLGVEDRPRLREFTPNLSWKEKEDLRGQQRHTQDIKLVDCDLHGLDMFLQRVAGAGESEVLRMSKILWDFLTLHIEHRGGHSSLSRGRYEWFYYTRRHESFDSLLIKRLRDASWLPAGGRLNRPCDVSLDDLPDEFERSAELAEALRMKAAVSTALAREIGVAPDDIEYLRTHRDEFRQWRAERSKPDFPARESHDPERRSERVAKQAENARKKQYDPKTRSVRTSDDPQAEAKTYLRELYTNDKDQMVCQACHDEMPFRLDDGKYYFEAVECWKDAKGEHRENHLALCPTCAAKYRHANGTDPTQVREAIVQASGLEVPIVLARQSGQIRFVATHLQDIRVVLEVDRAGHS